MNNKKEMRDILDKLEGILKKNADFNGPTEGSELAIKSRKERAEVTVKGTRADILFLFSELAEQLVKIGAIKDKRALIDLIDTFVEEEE
jgi:hypothetical protein